ncbi:MAG: CPBP family intramembrane metalloprotease [Bacteroidales bacterium]|nr:CPBP family intramembrane metalloprotease [Bacteroidales bacterium]
MKRLRIYLYSGLFLMLSVFFTLLIAILSEKSTINKYINPIGQLPILGPAIASFLLILFSRKKNFSNLNFFKFNISILLKIIGVFIIFNIIVTITQLIFGNIVYEPNNIPKELFNIQFPNSVYILITCFLTIFYAGFGEEIGWRGFLFNKLNTLPYLEMTLLLNIVWALWHLPMFILGGMGHGNIVFSFVLFTITCLEFGILLNYIRIKTNSVFGAIFLHPFANICGFISLGIFRIDNEFWAGHSNIISILILLPFSIYYYLEGKKLYNIKNSTFNNQILKQ